MGKIVNDSHIIGERGVIKFHDYCNSHFPYICFREIQRNDFGIDGEVELVRINAEGKKEMTGELLKVQIKASYGTGYLKKRRDGTFAFNAKKADLEYWASYNLDVILIIYDDETGSLYSKKIEQIDYLAAKKKSFPIDFSEENLLENGKNDFLERYSHNFNSRVSYENPESLTSNILYIKKHPKKLFIYESKYSSKKKIFDDLRDPDDAPYFVCYANKIISPYNITRNFGSFSEDTLIDTNPEVIEWDKIVKNQVYRNNLIELLNLMLKDFLRSKSVWYNKDHKRFYFAKPKEEDEKSIEKKSVKTGKVTSKKVVTFHRYAKDEFYRHIAFEVGYFFNMKKVYMTLSPKYLFTSDGKATITPAKVTKYTNFLTAREWNNQVLDQIWLALNFMKNDKHGINILSTDDVQFLTTLFIHQDVDFGIPSDIPKQKSNVKKITNSTSTQTSLFQ